MNDFLNKAFDFIMGKAEYLWIAMIVFFYGKSGYEFFFNNGGSMYLLVNRYFISKIF